MNDLPKLVNIKDAAKILGVTTLTLRNWDKAGKLKALRHPINNYRVYKREDIEDLIELITRNLVPSRPRLSKGIRKLVVRHGEQSDL